MSVKYRCQVVNSSSNALEVLCSEVLQLEEIAEELSRALRDYDSVRFGDALHPCCEVRRLAHNAALLRLSRSDQIAHHD
jgi:hypothetical protein